MTLDTQELRRLHGAATADASFKDIMAWDNAIESAFPQLCDAADRLARIEAVMVGEEAVEAMARAMCKYAEASWDIMFPQQDAPDYATAALAALRELIGGV